MHTLDNIMKTRALHRFNTDSDNAATRAVD